MNIYVSINGGVTGYKIASPAVNYKTAYTKARLSKKITELFVDEFSFLFGKVVAWEEDRTRIGASSVRVSGAIVTSAVGTVSAEGIGVQRLLKGAILYCNQKVIRPDVTRYHSATMPTLFATLYKFE